MNIITQLSGTLHEINTQFNASAAQLTAQFITRGHVYYTLQLMGFRSHRLTYVLLYLNGAREAEY